MQLIHLWRRFALFSNKSNPYHYFMGTAAIILQIGRNYIVGIAKSKLVIKRIPCHNGGCILHPVCSANPELIPVYGTQACINLQLGRLYIFYHSRWLYLKII